jgi:xanthine dehydrogenase iron-sulfur cluster and FAD-binding subunit A
MFFRLAEQYRAVVVDLVLSLQALARSLQDRGLAATCYTCGDGRNGQGASFVANLGDNHMVRFLVSDFGISWVESRDGHELVKLEGAEAIQELQRVAEVLQQPAPGKTAAKPDKTASTPR